MGVQLRHNVSGFISKPEAEALAAAHEAAARTIRANIEISKAYNLPDVPSGDVFTAMFKETYKSTLANNEEVEVATLRTD